MNYINRLTLLSVAPSSPIGPIESMERYRLVSLWTDRLYADVSAMLALWAVSTWSHLWIYIGYIQCRPHRLFGGLSYIGPTDSVEISYIGPTDSMKYHVIYRLFGGLSYIGPTDPMVIYHVSALLTLWRVIIYHISAPPTVSTRSILLAPYTRSTLCMYTISVAGYP